MDDAANEDARPLTKEERDMLISCLFRMSSAMYCLSKSYTDTMTAMATDYGIGAFKDEGAKSFLKEMKTAMDILYKLGDKFGVLENE